MDFQMTWVAACWAQGPDSGQVQHSCPPRKHHLRRCCQVGWHLTLTAHAVHRAGTMLGWEPKQDGQMCLTQNERMTQMPVWTPACLAVFQRGSQGWKKDQVQYAYHLYSKANVTKGSFVPTTPTDLSRHSLLLKMLTDATVLILGSPSLW